MKGSLVLKLTLAVLFAVLTGVGVASLLISQMVSANFGQYLSHVRLMEEGMRSMMGSGPISMMGGLWGGPPQAMMQAPERDFLASVNGVIAAGGVVAVGLALVLGWALSAQIVAPVRRLTAAAKRIAAGDLTQRVSASTKDEVGELATAFNTMAEGLERSETARRRLLADVVHELRTPLSLLQGHLEAMRDGIEEPTPQRLASLHEETLLLSRLVTDLRDLSLAQVGQLSLQREPLQMAPLLREEATQLRPRSQERGVNLEVTVPEALPEVLGDAYRLRQVLHNLVDNALRYTPPGGAISLQAQAPSDGGGELLVSVADTGKGVSAEDLPHIFDHFYRADPSRQRASGGSGLGLAVVKQVVEAHGGRVWATSTPGKGSTFFFTLPLAPPDHRGHGGEKSITAAMPEGV